MHKAMTLGPSVALSVTLAACASTKFSSTGGPRGPGLSFPGQKVAAVVMSPDESRRLGAEGELARELTRRGVEGIPAYNLIPPNESRDKERAKVLFNAAGVAGVVAMRVLGTEKEISSSSGRRLLGARRTTGRSGAPATTATAGAPFTSPSYLRTDTIVNVETLVYDLKTDKLVWAGGARARTPSGSTPSSRSWWPPPPPR